jgi:hypothetical protein
MDCDPFIVLALIDNTCFTETLVNTRCLSYRLCDLRFVQKNKLICLQIDPRTISGVNGWVITKINKVAVVRLDLDSYRERRVFLYVAPTGHYDMILGLP